MKGRIAEIFGSIQGEGPYLGSRQLFVRFFGCNLSCGYCDTRLEHFTEYAPQELFGKIKERRPGFETVSFTGGEPLLQKDFLKEIMRLTHAEGLTNYLETNGTLADELKEVIEYSDIVAMDLKLPSSTGLDGFWDAHKRFLKIALRKEVFLKAVVCIRTDIEDLRQGLRLIKGTNGSIVLILQPDSRQDYSLVKEKIETLRSVCLQEGIVTCVIPQVHKIIGVK